MTKVIRKFYRDGVEYKIKFGGSKPIITETYRFANSGGTRLHKDGYKIKEITIQWSCVNTTSGWSNTPSRGIVTYTVGTRLGYRSIFRFGSQWHSSSYVDSGYGFIGDWNNASGASGDTLIQKYVSNSTTSSTGSCIVTFDENGGKLKTGTTFGTWVQDVTYTHSADIKTRFNTIINASDCQIVAGNTGGTTSNDLMTIVYEKI